MLCTISTTGQLISLDKRTLVNEIMFHTRLNNWQLQPPKPVKQRR